MKSQGAARKLDVTFNLKSFSELILNVDDAPRLELMVNLLVQTYLVTCWLKLRAFFFHYLFIYILNHTS